MNDFQLNRYNLVTKTSGKLSSKNQLWIKETGFAFKSAMPFSLGQRSAGSTQLHTAPAMSCTDLRGA